ncbi:MULTISPECIES: ribonuclease R family protein [unclassified Oleiphilus]|jgi:ribonuclease R|nr:MULTISPECIES: ribonuclease R family protein [unclassified Oleiphilus]KZY49955.1 hypothetical protein A3732_05090 [Oleiphilus sp. HI0050]KZY73233.1 hypothetical protein A3740_19485 [Oleiphilus sp. HI0068]KZY85309.1 hypothetical protein A3741_02845 [Oleiphilus sp. HI0069]KZY96787.1 hypothetical protein A3743_04375 [Oleiphilus sp. HI0072]KZZ18940.1 hypothetical protein A3752_16095 [Oleiphilus sp. HI0081]
MLKLDSLNQLKQLKQDIKASRNLCIGTVKGSAYKFGFVTLDTNRDVYLPPDEMERVLPGDRVEVEVIKDAKNKKVAKLERLIESNTQFFCGKYIEKGKAAFVEPDIQGMCRWFFIPPQKRKKAKAKDLVVCKVTQHPFKSGKAQASIVELIGTDQDIGIESLYASKKHRLETSWSKVEQEQADAISEEQIAGLSEGRKNYCELPFVTIDSSSTKDIDDALYAEKAEQGWYIYIAIADPCAMIDAGSAIEKSLIKRASSVYFPGQTIAMLPEKLGSDICSLVEGKPRLAKVVKATVSETGDIESYELEQALIQSHKKLSYEVVGSFIDQGEALDECSSDIQESLKHLKTIADKRSEFRNKHNLIQKDRQEFYLELNDQGKIAEIKQKVFSSAHRIVEEAMVAANCCIAELISKSKLPGIYISHKGIRADRLESLDKVLQENIPEYKEDSLASLDSFVELSKQLSSNDELTRYQLLISRQLEKSQLSLEPAPHFGMGLQQYCNFTSPLRKASDFLVHRQLDAIAANNESYINEAQIEALSENSSKAKSAVYDVEQWLKCQYLAKNKQTLNATIHRVFSSGFQVRLAETGIEGFVSTKEMEGKYSFNQDLLCITNKEQSFQLDQAVQVKLKQIDWSRKQIQFELV